MANQPIYDMTDTWSQAGTKHTAIKMNVTDAASTADSTLLDLQIGGNSKAAVDKDGTLTLAGGLKPATDLAVADGGTGASDAAGARTNLGLGSISTRNLTVSTANPSGGTDGDIWFKV